MRFHKVILLYFSLAFLGSLSLSQNFEKGIYLSMMGYKIDPITHEEKSYFQFSEELKIISDSLFEYEYYDDITYIKGYGQYTLRSDIIKLKFEGKPKDFDTTSIVTVNSEPSKRDSITYKFIVRDIWSKIPLVGAIISFKNCTNNRLDSNIITKLGCETNKKGIANFKIAKNAVPCIIIISYVGSSPIIYSANDSLNKTIEIRMNYNISYIPKGEVKSYHIKGIDEDGFYLRGGIWNTWTYFKKID